MLSSFCYAFLPHRELWTDLGSCMPGPPHLHGTPQSGFMASVIGLGTPGCQAFHFRPWFAFGIKLDGVSHMAGPGVSLASRFREFVSVSGTLPQSGLVSKYFGHATFPGSQSSGQDLVTSTHRVSSLASQCRPVPQRFLQITPASFGQVGSFFSVCFSFNVVAHPRSVDASSWHPVVLIPMAAA